MMSIGKKTLVNEPKTKQKVTNTSRGKLNQCVMRMGTIKHSFRKKQLERVQYVTTHTSHLSKHFSETHARETEFTKEFFEERSVLRKDRLKWEEILREMKTCYPTLDNLSGNFENSIQKLSKDIQNMNKKALKNTKAIKPFSVKTPDFIGDVLQVDARPLFFTERTKYTN